MSLIAAGLTAVGCGSSTETFVAPAPTRCTVQAQSDTTAFAATGGTGSVRISANRECAWSARSDASWIGLPAQPSGQGDGTIQFTVAANADPATRSAGLNVNDQVVALSQQGSPCRYELSSSQETVDASGGQRTIHVQASSGQCTWTATTDAPWIQIVSGASGSANRDVVFEVARSTGPNRTGVVTIAGQSVQVVQGVGCTYATGVTSVSVGASGGISEVSVVAPAGCPWTAQSQSPWIVIVSGSSGTGAGVVRMSVAASDGPPRTGSATIAGVPIPVTQSSGCLVTIEPASIAAPVAGGASSVTVRAGGQCAWSASSNASWITIASAASGSGDAQLHFSVTANTGPARSGTLTIGGRTFTVNQPNGCTYSVSPSTVDVPFAGQAASASVATGTGCVWSAATDAGWISFPQPSGSGAAQVPFTVAANNGPPRSASLAIAGRIVVVNQASPCSWAFAPPNHQFDASGGAGNVLVFVIGGCSWNAVSTVDWITMTAGMDGTGPLLQFVVAPNGGAARVGIIKVGGADYQVFQGGR
jgi:hypothetical protein